MPYYVCQGKHYQAVTVHSILLSRLPQPHSGPSCKSCKACECVQGEIEIAGAKSGKGHMPTKQSKQTMIAPGVHRVELCTVDEVLFPMGPDEDTILL